MALSRRATRLLVALALVGLSACQTPDRGFSNVSSPQQAASSKLETATPRPVPRPVAKPAQSGAESTPLMHNICAVGPIFRSIYGPEATPDTCRKICDDLMKCVAFTYYKPSPASKNKQNCTFIATMTGKIRGAQAKKLGCVSWVNPRAKRRLEQLRRQGFELNIRRLGGNFREFSMDTADPTLCKEACQNLRKCKAFTYYRPGWPETQANCQLKTGKGSVLTNQPCCISGLK